LREVNMADDNKNSGQSFPPAPKYDPNAFYDVTEGRDGGVGDVLLGSGGFGGSKVIRLSESKGED
jgi:hypothetical protein